MVLGGVDLVEQRDREVGVGYAALRLGRGRAVAAATGAAVVEVTDRADDQPVERGGGGAQHVVSGRVPQVERPVLLRVAGRVHEERPRRGLQNRRQADHQQPGHLGPRQPVEQGAGGVDEEDVLRRAGVVDGADRGVVALGEPRDAARVRDVAGDDRHTVRRQVTVPGRVTHDRGDLVTTPEGLVDGRPAGPATRAEDNDFAHPNTSRPGPDLIADRCRESNRAGGYRRDTRPPRSSRTATGACARRPAVVDGGRWSTAGYPATVER